MSPTIELEDDQVQVGFRISRSLLAALDIEATLLGDATPGVQFTRSDALRSILSKVLNNEDNQIKLREIDARRKMETELQEHMARTAVSARTAASTKKPRKRKTRR